MYFVSCFLCSQTRATNRRPSLGHFRRGLPGSPIPNIPQYVRECNVYTLDRIVHKLKIQDGVVQNAQQVVQKAQHQQHYKHCIFDWVRKILGKRKPKSIEEIVPCLGGCSLPTITEAAITHT